MWLLQKDCTKIFFVLVQGQPGHRRSCSCYSSFSLQWHKTLKFASHIWLHIFFTVAFSSFSLITLLNGTVEAILCPAVHAAGNQFLLSLLYFSMFLQSLNQVCHSTCSSKCWISVCCDLVRGTRAVVGLGWERVLGHGWGGAVQGHQGLLVPSGPWQQAHC